MLARIHFFPGATTTLDNIDLPAGAPGIDQVVSAEIRRHVSVQIDATDTAGDKTAFVGLLDGAGAAVTGVAIAHAGGAGADIAVNASLASVAATPTKVDEDTITLNVNTTVADELILAYSVVGQRLKVA